MADNSKSKIKSFTDLEAWKESHRLVLMVYEITRVFPEEETFGLVSQMRRAAISVVSNIAEGFSRNSSKEKNPVLLYGFRFEYRTAKSTFNCQGHKIFRQ